MDLLASIPFWAGVVIVFAIDRLKGDIFFVFKNCNLIKEGV